MFRFFTVIGSLHVRSVGRMVSLFARCDHPSKCHEILQCLVLCEFGRSVSRSVVIIVVNVLKYSGVNSSFLDDGEFVNFASLIRTLFHGIVYFLISKG